MLKRYYGNGSRTHIMITVGVDEVGRGALVGNVVAAAVILPENFNLRGLTDSKKISAHNREILFKKITQICQYALGMVSAVEIDNINILNATMQAMKFAVDNLGVKYDRVLVDGNHCPRVQNCTAIIKGDLIEPCISAASIVAKVIRDRQMLALDKLYPEYGFASHKGYATARHAKALKKYGAISFEHRHSFITVKNNC